MRFARLLGALVLVLTALLWPSAAHAQPTLTVSPGSGVYAASQGMDLVILLRDLNGLSVAGGQVMLDENDITSIAVSVFRAEPVANGLAFRSIHLPMGTLGLGSHIFEVILTLSDGSTVRAGAAWQVLRSN